MLKRIIYYLQGEQAGIVETETHVFSGEPANNVTATTTVPLVATETRKVALENEDGTYSATGEIVSSQTISSKTRTVETITVSNVIIIILIIGEFDHYFQPEMTLYILYIYLYFYTCYLIQYKTERDGVVETRVEQKITIQSDGDPVDHDRALAEAIQEATAMNPDMTVEKIEIQQQTSQ